MIQDERIEAIWEWRDILTGNIPWDVKGFAEATDYTYQISSMGEDELRMLVNKRADRLSKEQRESIKDLSPRSAAILLWFHQRYRGDDPRLVLSHYMRFRAMIDFVYDNAEDLEIAGLMDIMGPDSDLAPVMAVTEALCVLPYDRKLSLEDSYEKMRPTFDKERIIRTASRWHELAMKREAEGGAKASGETAYIAPTLLGMQTAPARIRVR